jgi:flagellar biosynthesis protein FlhB
MAEENQDGQEKTEDPTPKRLQDGKEKGQVPRSRELNTAMVMIAGAFGLTAFGSYMGTGLAGVLETGFQPDRALLYDSRAVFDLARGFIGQGLLIVAPFAAMMLVVALATPALIGGWSFSVKSLAPRAEKLNPIKGLGRIFGLKGLIELVKALAKVLVVGSVGTLLMWLYQDDFRQLAAGGLQSSLAHGSRLFFGAFFALAASLLLVAAVDVPYQLFDHKKKLRMTKQEVKDEYKQTEGKPEVKGRIRQLQRELAQGRMMENVPTADVIVTNPTHFSVALKYDQLKMRAPQVVAKGRGEVALRIRELAREHRVPIFEAPPLARALYHTTELEQEVPGGLYLAVAQVLAYIYQLKGAGRQGERPSRPSLKLPEEFSAYAAMTAEEDR